MRNFWDQIRIQQYIDQEIEESLSLDYKAADALSRTESKKKEITKDVSAMANSAGGIIIYGVSEHQEPEKKHLPEKIDPIDQTQFPKEWLEQIINNVRPKISGIVIHPVPLDTGPNQVAYIVEIPQSITAHQATDFRYYKRFNFLSVPMADHEIKDVMGRNQHPTVSLEFQIEITTETINPNNLFETSLNPLAPKPKPKVVHRHALKIRARNVGVVFAKYVNVFILIPAQVLHNFERKRRDLIDEDGREYCEIMAENTIRDVVGVGGNLDFAIEKFGPSRYDPILPGLSLEIANLLLNEEFRNSDFSDEVIKWKVHADNAPQNNGEIIVGTIEIIQS